MQRKEAENEKRADRRGSSKKPYHPPEILYRETLEAMAAVCAPTPPAKADPGSCPMGPISS